MVSFGVRSLFTNIPLDRTIDIILKRVFDKQEIQPTMTKKELKELLILCKINVHFTFGGKTFVQSDGVAMGSPLGPVLDDIFMVELENTLVPTLTDYIKFWKRYVDDTIFFVKMGSAQYIVSILNRFETNIFFTCQMYKKCCLPFLNVLLTRNGNNIVTTVYRKTTTNDLYLNWNSFAPTSWKSGTLKAPAYRAYFICSSPELRKQEIQHLKQVFREKNDYPKWVINQVVEQVEAKHRTVTHSNNLPIDDFEQPSATNKEKSPSLLLPYQGLKGDFALKLMRKRLKTLLQNNFNTQIAFKGKKLNSCFQIKDTDNFEHKHDLVYHGKCPAKKCNDNYVGETGRHISERIMDHNGRDVNSHLLKHHMEKKHQYPQNKDFIILSSSFQNNVVKRKISEVLWIKDVRPTLNRQKISIELKLLN